MLITLILAVLILLVILRARRLKKRQEPASSNRYRAYQQTSTSPVTKKQMARSNSRIKSEPRRDATSKVEQIEPASTPVPKEQTSSLPKKKISPSIAPLSKDEEDPDVILGLKTRPASVSAPIPNDAQMPLKPVPPIITFFLMSEPGKPYSGYELLQAILSVDMRFGRHQIFHRHQEKTGHGNVLFSLAAATKPGSFDLAKIGSFSTIGLTLFFSAKDVADPLQVYELMLHTVGQLVEDLGGRVMDEHHQVLTPSKVVEDRQRLREYMNSNQAASALETTER